MSSNGLGLRVSRAVQGIVRSWWFLAVFLTVTIAWWAGIGRELLHDPYPFVAWTTAVSLVTQLDLIIVGIGQKQQQDKDSRSLTNQEEMLVQQQRALINQIDQMQLLVAVAKTSSEYEQRMEPLVHGAIDLATQIQQLVEKVGANDQQVAESIRELHELKTHHLAITERTLGVVEELIALHRNQKENNDGVQT